MIFCRIKFGLILRKNTFRCGVVCANYFIGLRRNGYLLRHPILGNQAHLKVIESNRKRDHDSQLGRLQL